MALSLVFVHGWSVTNLDTYGELPLRLKAEAALSGIEISIKEMDVQRKEQLEEQCGGLFAHESYFIRDRFSMLTFHGHDQEGFSLTGFDLIFTDIINGCAPVYSSEGKLIRGEIKGSEMLNRALVPNSTTLIDICLQRVVDKQVFRSSRLGDNMPGPDEGEFSGLSPGMDFID
ncbi:MAG: hypothetical protein ABIQ40_03875 [Bacteroidia bacterium]